MAESLYEAMLAALAPGDDSPPPEGATDSVGMGERIARTRCTVDGAARGDYSRGSMEEARQQLRDAQSALVTLGFDLGQQEKGAMGIDAVWSPGTRSALASFQEENGMSVTGHLDAHTYESLMAMYEQAVETAGGSERDDFTPMPAPRSVPR